MALDADDTGLRSLQPENASQQDGFAGAGAPDDAEHLVLPHLHVETVVHNLAAKPVDQSLHLQDRVNQMPISIKRTANKASARITRKMACTTATVVNRPSSRDESRTCMPR